MNLKELIDPIIAQKIRKLIKEKLVGHEKKTVIYATHNLHEAEELCDSIAVIHKGKIKTEGNLDQIKLGLNVSKSYFIGLKNFEHSVLKNIQDLEIVKNVKPIPLHSISDTFKIEIELNNSNGTGTKIASGNSWFWSYDIAFFFEASLIEKFVSKNYWP